MPDLTRRRFIAGGASLGALTLLTGCDVTGQFSAEEMLKRVSKFNDGVQALIFNPTPWRRLSRKAQSQKPFRSTPITTSTSTRSRRQGPEAGSARAWSRQEGRGRWRGLQAAAGQAG
jgi:hypothetical protein